MHFPLPQKPHEYRLFGGFKGKRENNYKYKTCSKYFFGTLTT